MRTDAGFHPNQPWEHVGKPHLDLTAAGAVAGRFQDSEKIIDNREQRDLCGCSNRTNRQCVRSQPDRVSSGSDGMELNPQLTVPIASCWPEFLLLSLSSSQCRL
jgi:hypothetical protein